MKSLESLLKGMNESTKRYWNGVFTKGDYIWSKDKRFKEDADTIIIDGQDIAHFGIKCNCPGCPYASADWQGNEACYALEHYQCVTSGNVTGDIEDV